jgi:hypothetical protein
MEFIESAVPQVQLGETGQWLIFLLLDLSAVTGGILWMNWNILTELTGTSPASAMLANSYTDTIETTKPGYKGALTKWSQDEAVYKFLIWAATITSGYQTLSLPLVLLTKTDDKNKPGMIEIGTYVSIFQCLIFSVLMITQYITLYDKA